MRARVFVILVSCVVAVLYLISMFSSINKRPREEKRKTFYSGKYYDHSLDEITFIFSNMDHRTDRREEFLSEMEHHGIPRSRFNRIAGVKHSIPSLGNNIVWLNALTFCARSNKRLCCLFEDDFVFLSPYKNNSDVSLQLFFSLVHSFPFHFDVVFLAGAYKHPIQGHTHYETDEPNIYRTRAVFGSAGFCATTKYVNDVFIDNVKDGIQLQEEHFKLNGVTSPQFTFDFYYRRLQPVDNWFALKVGMQRPSYSDTEKKMVVYEW